MRPRAKIRREANDALRFMRDQSRGRWHVRLIGEFGFRLKMALDFGPGPNGYGPGSDIFWWPRV